MPAPILDNIRKILDNPNGCLIVERLLDAIATECERIGSEPFNSMGGHFTWQAIGRDIRLCREGIIRHTYDRHIVRGPVYDKAEGKYFHQAIGLTKE